MIACLPLLIALLGPERPVDGTLVAVDFLHRSGQLRRIDDGRIVDFRLSPFGTVLYLGAEADLRDVPLGTLLHASTDPDAPGAFGRMATLRDDFTTTARDAIVDRIDAAGGKIVLTTQTTLRVGKATRFWKGGRVATLGDLASGDALRWNLTEGGLCAEVWAGSEAIRRATEGQNERRRGFIRARGLPAQIDRVQGKTLSVTILGDPEGLRTLMKAEGIDPARWATEHRPMDAVVANDELRTYNPPVDRKRARVLAYEALPVGNHGGAGVRWVIEPDLLLEGFRKGAFIRLFAHQSWPVNDMPFGESLYSEAPDARPPFIDPNLYPYRTDSGNAHLPWHRPKPGEFPPFHSDHEVIGELVKVDDHGRSGRFRTDRTDAIVTFTMPPYGAVIYLGAEAELADVPIGTRCHFSLHQDDRGMFTRATVITDEFTRLTDDRLAYRLDTLDRGAGRLGLAVQHALVKDEKEAMIRPPDFGRELIAVDARTRVWKGAGPATMDDLCPGDELLLNTTGQTATSRGVCRAIWAGVEAQKRVSDGQRSASQARLRARGFPAWIERVEGKTITVTFFSGRRREFSSLLGGDPSTGFVFARLADDELRPTDGPPLKLTFLGHPPDADDAGTYGSSGVRWRLEASSEVVRDLRPGRVMRISREGWPGGASVH